MAEHIFKSRGGKSIGVDFDTLNEEGLNQLKSARSKHVHVIIDGKEGIIEPSKLDMEMVNQLRGKAIQILDNNYDEPWINPNAPARDIPSQIYRRLGEAKEQLIEPTAALYENTIDAYSDTKDKPIVDKFKAFANVGKEHAINVAKARGRMIVGAIESVEELPYDVGFIASNMLPGDIKEKGSTEYKAQKWLGNYIKSRNDAYTRVINSIGGRDIYSGIGAFIPDAIIFALSDGAAGVVIPAIKRAEKGAIKKIILKEISSFEVEAIAKGLTEKEIKKGIRKITLRNYAKEAAKGTARETAGGAIVGALEQHEKPVMGAVEGAAMGAMFSGIIRGLGVTKNTLMAFKESAVRDLYEVAINPDVANFVRNIKSITGKADDTLLQQLVFFKNGINDPSKFKEILGGVTVVSDTFVMTPSETMEAIPRVTALVKYEGVTALVKYEGEETTTAVTNKLLHINKNGDVKPVSNAVELDDILKNAVNDGSVFTYGGNAIPVSTVADLQHNFNMEMGITNDVPYFDTKRTVKMKADYDEALAKAKAKMRPLTEKELNDTSGMDTVTPYDIAPQIPQGRSMLETAGIELAEGGVDSPPITFEYLANNRKKIESTFKRTQNYLLDFTKKYKPSAETSTQETTEGIVTIFNSVLKRAPNVDEKHARKLFTTTMYHIHDALSDIKNKKIRESFPEVLNLESQHVELYAGKVLDESDGDVRAAVYTMLQGMPDNYARMIKMSESAITEMSIIEQAIQTESIITLAKESAEKAGVAKNIIDVFPKVYENFYGKTLEDTPKSEISKNVINLAKSLKSNFANNKAGSKGRLLFSPDKRASIKLMPDGEMQLILSKDATSDQIFHELFHGFRRHMPANMKLSMRNYAKKELGSRALNIDGTLSDESEELLAKLFDNWIRNTETRLPGKMQGIFENIRDNLDESYNKGINVVNPEIKEIFDGQFSNKNLFDTMAGFQHRGFGKFKSADKPSMYTQITGINKSEFKEWTISKFVSDIQYLMKFSPELYTRAKLFLGNPAKGLWRVNNFVNSFVYGVEDKFGSGEGNPLRNVINLGEKSIKNKYVDVNGEKFPMYSYISNYLAAKRLSHLVEERGMKDIPYNMKNYKEVLEHFNTLTDEDKLIIEGRENLIANTADKLMDILVESGIINSAERDIIQESNIAYVPFHRFFFENELSKTFAGSVSGKALLKKLNGSTREVNDVVENMALNMLFFVKKADENIFLNDVVSALKAQEEHGLLKLSDFLIEKKSNDMYKVGEFNSELNRVLKSQGVDDSVARKNVISKAEEKLLEIFTKPKNKGANDIILREVMRDGSIETKVYECVDPLLADALRRPQSTAIASYIAELGVGKVSLKGVKELQRAGIILHPTFIGGNITRDMIMSSFTDVTAPTNPMSKEFMMHSLAFLPVKGWEALSRWIPTFFRLVAPEKLDEAFRKSIHTSNLKASGINPNANGAAIPEGGMRKSIAGKVFSETNKSKELLEKLRVNNAIGSEFYEAGNIRQNIRKMLSIAEKEDLTYKTFIPKTWDILMKPVELLKYVASISETTTRLINAEKVVNFKGSKLADKLQKQISVAEKNDNEVLVVNLYKKLGKEIVRVSRIYTNMYPELKRMHKIQKQIDVIEKQGNPPSNAELKKFNYLISEEQRVIDSVSKMDRSSIAYRDASADFGEMGTISRNIGKFANFYTAAIAGTREEYKAFAKNPVGNFIKLGEVAGAYLALKAKWGVPDEEINPVSRNLFLHLDIDGKKIRIPKPYGFVGLGINLAEMAYSKVVDGGDPQDRERFLKNVWQIFPDFSSLYTPAGNIAVGMISNKDLFFGSPIVPRSVEKKAPSLQYTPSTSTAAKALSGIVNSVAGTRTAPAKIDFAIKQLTGAVGRSVLASHDTFADWLNDDYTRPAPETSLIRDLTGLKKFTYVDPKNTTYSNQLRLFYENFDKSVEAKSLFDSGHDYSKLTNVQKASFSFYDPLSKASTEISKYMNLLNQVADPKNNSMSPEEKREIMETIAQAINMYAKEYNAAYFSNMRNKQ